MEADDIMTISAAVVALTSLFKWSGYLPDRLGPLAVLVLSALGVAVWGFSQEVVDRADTFGYFSGWIVVAMGSAGVYGFTRAGASAITAIKSPPPGAGQSATLKE